MELRKPVYKWLKSIQEWFYPRFCPLCLSLDVGEVSLCGDCHEGLPWIGNSCRRCGAAMAVDNGLCGDCLQHPPLFDRAEIPLHYRYPINGLLQAFKFSGQLHHSHLLASLIRDHLQGREGPLPQLLIPVPLHSARLRQRGFNQAYDLARHLSEWLAIPLSDHGVVRMRETTSQARLDGAMRRRNLEGAFRAMQPMPRHVAIVDDVVTTGTTANELAKVLRGFGAEEIEVWAVARGGY